MITQHYVAFFLYNIKTLGLSNNLINFTHKTSESVTEIDFHQFIFAKSDQVKWHTLKQLTALFYSNNLSYATLLLGPKRFIHSKALEMYFVPDQEIIQNIA